jgi:hypothetical protein
MAFSGCRIMYANSLLNISKSDEIKYVDRANKIVKILNFYYCSPIYMIFGGHKLKQKLTTKYYIQNNSTLNDKLLNILTFMFLDELVMIVMLIIAVLLMYISQNISFSFIIGTIVFYLTINHLLFCIHELVFMDQNNY